MNKIYSYIIGIAAVALLIIGTSNLILVNKLNQNIDVNVGTAGDTYQTAKVYSKVITTNVTTTAISCNNWLIKGVKFYVTPGASNSATTTIAVGVAANGTTTTLVTSLTTGTFSTSTAVYLTQDTAAGAGQLCTSSQYINANFGAAVTTTHGVLSVDYLNYQ